MLDDEISEAMFGGEHGFMRVEMHCFGGGSSSGLLVFLFFLFLGLNCLVGLLFVWYLARLFTRLCFPVSGSFIYKYVSS